MNRALPAALLSALCFTCACNNPAPVRDIGGAGAPAAGQSATVAGGSAAGSAAPAGAAGQAAGSGSAGVPSLSVGGAGAGAGAAAVAGAASEAGSGGTAAEGGAGGTDEAQGGTGGTTPTAPSGPRTAAGYMNLAPPMGAPLDGKGKDLDPPAPTGWVWYEIEGAICRDGSPTGFFVHTGTAKKLAIYLEGGGACSNAGFCGFNPSNANQSLSGDGQVVLNTALGAIEGRQQPGVYTSADHLGAPAGLFDFANAANPFKDWSQVYVPYCTGDVHFGTKRNGSVPGLTGQNFVGHDNMKLFISRIVPTFKDQVDQVILTGASAGGFGAALNYSMVQDAFGEVQVDVLDDSGPPFDDKYMPVCMQKNWREAWGFDGALPPDCADCRDADGGGLLHLADFLLKKHPSARIAMISSMEDEVIRLFYSVGVNDCGNYEAADPVEITLGQLGDPMMLFSAQTYTEGLNDLRTRYASSGRFSTFFMPGMNHQHIFRAEFFDTFSGTTQAKFVSEFIDGKANVQVGP